MAVTSSAAAPKGKQVAADGDAAHATIDRINAAAKRAEDIKKQLDSKGTASAQPNLSQPSKTEDKEAAAPKEAADTAVVNTATPRPAVESKPSEAPKESRSDCKSRSPAPRRSCAGGRSGSDGGSGTNGAVQALEAATAKPIRQRTTEEVILTASAGKIGRWADQDVMDADV